MRIRGIGTAKRVAGWARSQFRRGPVILGYHRVATSRWDPQKLCVSQDNFVEQLEVMTRVARPISLQQLLVGLKEGAKQDRSFVVTIDDGYTDTLEVAAPILERFDVPATAFVTTGLIGRPFWWCEIQQMVEDSAILPSEIDIRVCGHEFRWTKVSDTLRERARLVQAMGDLFRLLPFGSQDEAVSRLRSEFGANTLGSSVSAMSREQILSLSNTGRIEIGSHAVTHTSLANLGIEEQRAELQKSKSDLEDICGSPVVSCSYPNGRISTETADIARGLGYSSGCTSREELVAQSCDPLQLPRLWVGDWDGDHFSRWLKWWIR